MPVARTALSFFLLALPLALTGCGEPPAPIRTPGGDLVVHHQLDLFKLIGGTRIMFRDEAVLRFYRDARTGELTCAHDPKTQAGGERLHAFMRPPAETMPQVQYTRESHPPEWPTVDQAYRVKVKSHWVHEFLGPVEADTEYLVGLEPDGAVAFKSLRKEESQLTDTSYSWVNSAEVHPFGAPAGDQPAMPDAVVAGVGEFARESQERVEFLQQAVPALGDAWRSALIDLNDE